MHAIRTSHTHSEKEIHPAHKGDEATAGMLGMLRSPESPRGAGQASEKIRVAMPLTEPLRSSHR